ncbi:MAG TPA: trypsin-like peptidase domain-containing protein [Usitatibacter sp.]|nr:trypsin-like peptidase domain-containing protein [Usitatibacter sp.]
MRRILLVLFALVLAAPAARAERVFSAQAPQAARPKSAAPVGLRLVRASPAAIRMPALDADTVAGILRENSRGGARALKLGVVREAPQGVRRSAALRWSAVPGGMAAQWSVTVDGARALRLELTVDHAEAGSKVRYASAVDPSRAWESALPASGATWSPVIDGGSAIVELFAPGASFATISVSLTGVADHIADPAQAGFEKDATQDAAGSCEVDFACAASADPALGRVGSSVARITYVSDGYVYACTGTLLNPGDGSFTPYFYTAAHCVHDAQAAESVDTLWFYQESSCGSDANVPGVQLAGGAQLLVTDTSRDATLLRLNDMPPAGAVYAGWDSSPIDYGATGVGIHHPGGGVKKVSEGVTTYNPADDYMRVTWSMGVTEGGSSGSGLFTEASSGTQPDYLLRGTLYGGESACSGAPANAFDVYSRFDRVWPEVAPYLSAESTQANHTGLWSDPDEPGWGISLEQEQGVIVATLFAYGPDGEPEWLSASALREQSADTYSGDLYATTGAAYDAQAWTPIGVSTVGTLSVTFASAGQAVLTYVADGITVTKAVALTAFGPGGPPSCRLTTASRAQDGNYQGLWWNPAQSGWGVSIADQGGVLFAVLFVYDASGRPLWLVAPDVQANADGSYSGTLYRTHGAGLAEPWQAASAQAVGTLSLRFADGETGTLSYSVDGESMSAPITRFAAASAVPACD